ncbi:hypothetical protein SPRG_04727 [Saprolegnia parasitica CBS 223.65]|uniref:Uncharacterized protein n=1 Tax=Saprolegnia parasitica (strain CBS 223.65) TaxID=695850 RepID=A0A067CWC8_SAPPC|nr:hypothetical protein SPRG_04727 [Saprolegnia parasitica CBS 223.65]KDO30826.1 hypothetical protein SPRG_04727 [Saprolegnia parasitica CBS 223.65]|eukprot:XP_012198523.1 hypothetical protein SPRG_04727 [Saprolegnia parasitica CBS 223.65]
MPSKARRPKPSTTKAIPSAKKPNSNTKLPAIDPSAVSSTTTPSIDAIANVVAPERLPPLDAPRSDTTSAMAPVDAPARTSDTEPDGIAALGGVETGDVILVYELYREPFPIENGAIATSAIDEAYALSFVMPACHIHLSVHAPAEKRERDIQGDAVYLPEIAPGLIGTLCASATYYVYVTEDAATLQAVPPSTTQRGSFQELTLGDGRGFDSCTCIEGTPCVDEGGCRNWRSRYAIATEHGWEGFGLEGSLE